ncbi:endonuclease/exonuclease/phosphatase family protein [Paenibacillus sp. Marseille-Q4541]|uniref:endonuclease/exonuclease/phosphatase family protein n=1 Tax=Paenibacillus sp. Marseille-Q4541 TaxID=2831522 RepID=UPI001BAD478A|nr:endonuclease/exonuclease/phosphatase family protein [Paenibacillus sp. Marseille-Q4541]
MNHTMMTFNLRYNEPRDGVNSWPNRVNQVAEVISSHKASVIGTQEGLYEMLNQLQSNLPGYAWLGSGRLGGEKDEHCAVLYNTLLLEALEDGQFWLSESPDQAGSISWNSGCPRICTWVHFREKDTGSEFVFYNTHLDHLSHEARMQGAKLLTKEIQQQQEGKYLPIILTGDFNSTPDDQTIQFLRGELDLSGERSQLKDTFLSTHSKENIGGTFHDFKGGTDGELIDYIFVSQDWDVHSVLVDRRSFEGRYPSDHYPVVANLSMKS